MRSTNLLVPLSAALLISLAGCQKHHSSTDDTMQAPAQQSVALEAAQPSNSPIPPGASGFIPAASGGFSVMTADQQAALRGAGKAPCSVDMLNGSAPNSAEALSLGRADSLEIVGWVLNPRKEAPREFAIVLEGDAAAYTLRGIAGGPRPDVAKVFSSESAASAGYGSSGALADVAAGTYAIQLAQDTYNVLTRCETGWAVQVTE